MIDQLPPVGAEVPDSSGLVVPGNLDLSNRPKVKNPDGSISTVRSIGVNVDGKEVLIPTVIGNKVVSDEEAIKEYKRTGQHLGIFDTPEHSTAFAQKLHETEAARLDKPSLPPIGGEVGAVTEDVPFVPRNSQEWLDRLKAAARDVPVGMIKGAARVGQSIPGVASATDWAYGLPKGASVKATEPSNAAQTAGTYLNDIALISALGAVEAGGPILSKAAGYISNPTAAEQAANMARGAASFGADTVKAVGAKLSSGGPVTPEKVAMLIVKYGKDAVKGALVAGGGYGAWQTVKHLF